MQPLRRLGRPTGVRTSFLVLLAFLGAIAVAPYPSPPARASCAAPSLDLGPRPTLERGAQLTVEGIGFEDGCQDVMSCSAVPGCDDCEYDDPPPEPLSDVDLVLRQGGQTWALGTADADEGGAIAWAFRLPPGVHAGKARLVAGAEQPVQISVR